jgi:hypothetical protein
VLQNLANVINRRLLVKCSSKSAQNLAHPWWVTRMTVISTSDGPKVNVSSGQSRTVVWPTKPCELQLQRQLQLWLIDCSGFRWGDLELRKHRGFEQILLEGMRLNTASFPFRWKFSKAVNGNRFKIRQSGVAEQISWFRVFLSDAWSCFASPEVFQI